MAAKALDSILSITRDVARTCVADNASVTDEQANWPEASIRALQSAGLTGLVVSEEYGGWGHGINALTKVCEILGYHCASTGLCFGMHCVGSAVIGAKPTEKHIDEYLLPILHGEHITTLSLSEPGSGAHFYIPGCTLESVNNHSFQLNGEKSFVTNGGRANSYVVSAVTGEDSELGEFSCVLLDRDAKGVEWGAPWRGLGMRGNSSLSVRFNEVMLPKYKLLGEAGDQMWYAFENILPYFLAAMSGVYLGIASSAFDQARKHIESRTHSHSGMTLSQNNVLQHRLGALWSEIEMMRSHLYRSASDFDKGRANNLFPIMSAKAQVAGCAVNIINEAMTLCGGVAYRDSSMLARHLRDARAAHVMSPTTDILYTWLGRGLLGENIFGE